MEPISTDISLVGTNLEADAKRSVGKNTNTHTNCEASSSLSSPPNSAVSVSF
jgi:hypothetical protein